MSILLAENDHQNILTFWYSSKNICLPQKLEACEQPVSNFILPIQTMQEEEKMINSQRDFLDIMLNWNFKINQLGSFLKTCN